MVRVVTYNVHRFLGTDRVVAPARTAAIIASLDADIVALQEMRAGRARLDGLDHASAVAHLLGMDLHFFPTIRLFGERIGLGLLTARRSRLVKAGRLPGMSRRAPLESRGALWAKVEVDGVVLNVINTHLGLIGPERRAQARELVGPEWLGHPSCAGPTILLGDLNARPGSGAHRRLSGTLTDATIVCERGRWQPTFHSRLPVVRIDHAFVSSDIAVDRIEPLRTPLTRLASDHLPLVVDLEIAGVGRRGAEPEIEPAPARRSRLRTEKPFEKAPGSTDT